MIKTKKGLLLALLLPIVFLAALVAYKKYILSFGQAVVLPISGYDPRDIISGHYLRYNVEYPVNGICSGVNKKQYGYICLDNKTFALSPPPQCKILIRGTCQYEHFSAGIERFYVPENKAEYLDRQIRGKKASIVISVIPSGQAQVKDLLIDGKSWQNP